MKKLFFLLLIGAFVIGNNSGCKNRENQSTDSTEVVSNVLTVDEFLATPEKWTGEEVVISGTVSHICRHSGKRLFLFSDNPEKIVKINVGGDFSTFDVEYEGSDVEITGTVIEDEKIDANYLDEWEAEIKEAIANEDEEAHCDTEKKAIAGQTDDEAKAKEAKKDPYAKVKKLRKKLAESGKTYIAIYAIDCKNMKELEKEDLVN